jgi:hypothetical protein
MYPSFACESKLLIIPFLRFLSMHLPFAKSMPIIFANGIKRPCYPFCETWLLLEGGGDGRDLDNK